MLKQFAHPILVGHSFGAMFGLLFPELEKILDTFIILNSAPTLWLEAANQAAQENQLPNLDQELAALAENPTPENFSTALLACAPYYFTQNYLEAGKKIIIAITL